MSDFGQRLKEARKLKGFTQKDLSKMLGVAQSTIANYETNERFPGEIALKEIADCLKISVDYLLGVTEVQTSPKKAYTVEAADPNKPMLAEAQILYQLLADQSASDAVTYVKSLQEYLTPNQIIQRIFEPVMQLVGDNWQIGKIDISKEHYITGIMEHLLIMVANSNNLQATKPYKVALVVPGAEEHVLPLKMAAEQFRLHGWEVYYLGRSLPVSSLNKIIAEHHIDLLAMSVTLNHHLNSAEHLVQAIRLMPRNHQLKILMSGQAVKDSRTLHPMLQADYYVESLEGLDSLIPLLEAQLQVPKA